MVLPSFKKLMKIVSFHSLIFFFFHLQDRSNSWRGVLDVIQIQLHGGCSYFTSCFSAASCMTSFCLLSVDPTELALFPLFKLDLIFILSSINNFSKVQLFSFSSLSQKSLRNGTTNLVFYAFLHICKYANKNRIIMDLLLLSFCPSVSPHSHCTDLNQIRGHGLLGPRDPEFLLPFRPLFLHFQVPLNLPLECHELISASACLLFCPSSSLYCVDAHESMRRTLACRALRLFISIWYLTLII